MVQEIKLEEYVAEMADEVRQKIVILSKKDRNYSIDPLTIIYIVSIIIEIVKWFVINYGKNKNTTELAESFGKMNWFQKWILWSFCRRESESKIEAKYIYRSLLEKINEMSLEERIKLFTLKESVL